MPAFHVSRNLQIRSDAETVFRTLSDFATWNRWSPWLLSDKEATVTLKGDPAKVGGGYAWDGKVVGAGEMKHTELQPPGVSNSEGLMRADLRFTRPWKSESKVMLTTQKAKDAEGRDATEVCWAMDGSLPFFLFWMKPMMVSMLSMDFDRGLRMLKELIETGEVASQTTVNGITPLRPIHLIGLSAKSTLAEMGPSMQTTMTQVKKSLADACVATDGQWVSVYDDMCLKTQTVSYTSGIICAPSTPVPAGLLERSTPGFDAMHVSHTGRYEHMGNAWSAAYQNIQAMKRKPNSKLPGLELYLSDPDSTSPQELLTDIYVPVT